MLANIVTMSVVILLADNVQLCVRDVDMRHTLSVDKVGPCVSQECSHYRPTDHTFSSIITELAHDVTIKIPKLFFADVGH